MTATPPPPWSQRTPAQARGARQELEQYYSDRTAAAFAAASASRARDPHQLSISQIGRCLRQSAFKLAGTPVDEEWADRNHRSAELGTWIHLGFLPELASVLEISLGDDSEVELRQRMNEAVARLTADDDTVSFEEPVVLRAAGIELPGTYDLYQPAAPYGPTLVDAKSAGEWRWRNVLSTGTPEEYRWQSWGYATALVQDGKPVEWLAWLYLRRDNGDELPRVEPFTPDHALEVIRRVGRIVAAAEDPMAAPREAPGPSAALKRSWSPCDNCAWLRQCWPKAAPGQAPQAVVARERPNGAAHAALTYHRHSVAQSAAKTGMEFARAVLTGVPDGYYPDPEQPTQGVKVKRRKDGAITVTAAKPPTPAAVQPPTQRDRSAAEAAEAALAFIVDVSTDGMYGDASEDN